MKLSKYNPLNSFREIVFGLEDGMISTMGAVTGIASGSQNRYAVILAGLVIISVESLSMAAGTFLSSKAEEEYLANNTKNKLHRRLHLQSINDVKQDAVYMWLAYCIGGLVPISAYLLLPISVAIWLSVICTVIGLILLAIVKSKLTRTSQVRSIAETVIVSLGAAGIGFLVGNVVGKIFPEVAAISMLV